MAVSALRSATGDALQLRFCWRCSSQFCWSFMAQLTASEQRLSAASSVSAALRNSQQAEATWSAVLQLRFLDQGTISYRPYSLEPRLHGVRASTVQTEKPGPSELLGAVLLSARKAWLCSS
jgi:hypothetical protein